MNSLTDDKRGGGIECFNRAAGRTYVDRMSSSTTKLVFGCLEAALAIEDSVGKQTPLAIVASSCHSQSAVNCANSSPNTCDGRTDGQLVGSAHALCMQGSKHIGREAWSAVEEATFAGELLLLALSSVPCCLFTVGVATFNDFQSGRRAFRMKRRSERSAVTNRETATRPSIISVPKRKVQVTT